MKREELIKEYLAKPIAKGDLVKVRGLGRQDKVNFGNTTNVLEVYDDESIKIAEEREPIKKEDYEKSTLMIGYNPFPTKTWDSEMTTINFDLEGILSRCGLVVDKKEHRTIDIPLNDHIYKIPYLNWSPTLIDQDGNEVEYQRGFEWNLNDKKLLIDSIYKKLDIGKIIFRNRSYSWVLDEIKKGKKPHFSDIVDGKQRLNAIISFVMDEFEDLNGFLFSELSTVAKRKFLGTQVLTYVEIGESVSDIDVHHIFININTKGVRMSEDHLSYVKNLRIS